MYVIFKRLKLIKLIWGWGKILFKNVISVVDDVEWIYCYRNKISYLDVLEMEMVVFNNLVLDLIGVIYIYIC